MRNKIIIIGFAAFALLTLVSYLLFGGQKKPTEPKVASSSVEQENFSTESAITFSSGNQETGDYIVIGGAQGAVRMKNFYTSAVSGEEGVVVLLDSTSSSIWYDTDSSSFHIYAADTLSLKSAEQQLLVILGVSQADICKLKAFEHVGNSPETGLSFCVPGV